MRFSLRFNNDLTVVEARALAVAAEESGFDQIWVSHDLMLRSAAVLATAMLEATDRLEVGIGILNPISQHPAEIAMLAATLDEASGGRFLLGLSSGSADFLSWVGLDAGRPVATVREAIAALRALLAGEVPESGSRFVFTERASLRFESLRVPPIYVGAMSPKMLSLCGELAEGALPLLFPPEHWHEARRRIAEGEARRDPSLPPIDVAACVWISVHDDGALARRALAEKVAYYGHALSPLILERLGLDAADFEPLRRLVHDRGDLAAAAELVDARMLAIGVAGTAADVVERLRPLVSAGVRHLSFGPPLGPDRMAAVRLLGTLLERFP